MRRITQRATADAAVADEHDAGHRTEPGKVEFMVTWPWEEDDAASGGPRAPTLHATVLTDHGDVLSEATLGEAAIDTLRALLFDLDRDDRWRTVGGERNAVVTVEAPADA